MKQSPPGKRVHQATGWNYGERDWDLVKAVAAGNCGKTPAGLRAGSVWLCRAAGADCWGAEEEEGAGTARRSKRGRIYTL